MYKTFWECSQEYLVAITYYMYEMQYIYISERKMKWIRQICRKDKQKKDIYLVWMNIYLLFIIYADTYFNFKFAHIQKHFIKNYFKYKNVRMK